MATETLACDAAKPPGTPEALAAYLSESMAGGDAAKIAQAIGTLARARGMTVVARDAGAARESLCEASRGVGNPEFGTIMKVSGALGLYPTTTATHPGAEPARSLTATDGQCPGLSGDPA